MSTRKGLIHYNEVDKVYRACLVQSSRVVVLVHAFGESTKLKPES